MTVQALMEILRRCPPEMEVKAFWPFDANGPETWEDFTVIRSKRASDRSQVDDVPEYLRIEVNW